MFEADCQLSGRVLTIGDPCIAKVVWSPVKSLWFSGMLVGWLMLGLTHFTWSAYALFLTTSAVTLCGGHSLGMHRRLIYRSFECSLWLEQLGVYLGTLVGLGGPFNMMRTHDIRDWAQRRAECHDYFGHRRSLFQDFWWQVHCKIELVRPPQYAFPAALNESRFYRVLQSTSMLQQLPWAIFFFFLGGWGWVAWGICARVVVSIFGHWLIGHFAHGAAGNHWQVEGAAVQGRNVDFCGLISFGECWHNNHHAYPGSAKIGLLVGQSDPGWWTLSALEKMGLVWKVKLPEHLAVRQSLVQRET